MGDAHSREIYDAVLEQVDDKTGDGRAPLVTEAAVVMNVSRSLEERDPDAHPNSVRSALAAALARDDLFRWEDPESEIGTVHLGIDDPDVLEAKIESYVTQSRVTALGGRRIRAARERIEAQPSTSSRGQEAVADD